MGAAYHAESGPPDHSTPAGAHRSLVSGLSVYGPVGYVIFLLTFLIWLSPATGLCGLLSVTELVGPEPRRSTATWGIALNGVLLVVAGWVFWP
jgi:hypothetical protein